MVKLTPPAEWINKLGFPLTGGEFDCPSFRAAWEQCVKNNVAVIAAIQKEAIEASTREREIVAPFSAEQLIDRLRAHVKNTEMGEEHLGRGSSTYNWGKHYISVLELLLVVMASESQEQGRRGSDDR